jgi:hypothetical protein
MFEIKGKVISIEDILPFQTKKGVIYQKLIVLEVEHSYQEKVVYRTIPLIRKGFEEQPKMYCKEGDEVAIKFDIDGRQGSNGVWFTNLIAHNITKGG